MTIALATVNVNGVERADGGDPGGSPRGFIRAFLHAFAKGLCCVCGQETLLDAPNSAANRAEACHILPGKNGSKTGWQPGNLFNGCRACNIAMNDIDARSDIVGFTYPNSIPAEWPTGWRSASSQQNGTAFANDAAAIRKALGLRF